MKLSEAFKLAAQSADPGERPLSAGLGCSFTPLHLETYLKAWLRRRMPSRGASLATGQYGDLRGTLERFAQLPLDAAAVALEWNDLDPRLALRQLSGWEPAALPDVLATARSSAEALAQGILKLADAMPVAVSLPSLPLPPMAHTPGWQAGSWVAELRLVISQFSVAIAGSPHVRLLDSQRLDHLSPPSERLDLRSECMSGFPFRLKHACVLAEQLSQLLAPPAPMKGLITDLDNTFWSGIVGDDGVEAVSWSLEDKSLLHGVYQQLLSSLADAGVLVAVASKNDPLVVQRAFERADLVCGKEHLFPIEVHWGPKSESVTRILQTWNIAADSVVFVDDSPLELAEVSLAHPGLQCLAFPCQDDQKIYELIVHLRDCFGKPALSAEDALRLDSLRQRSAIADVTAGAGHDLEAFQRKMDADIEVSWHKAQPDPRALELVNKTNQFNLNGRRFDEGTWLGRLRDPDASLMLVSYKDKFGPLGKIAVLMGVQHGRRFRVDAWVLSCRAFARRVEHRCLERLFERLDVDEIELSFEATPRNGPLREMLAELVGQPVDGPTRITRQAFQARCPALYHRVSEVLP